MKRYLLFTGDEHGTLGGWSDFEDSYDTAEEALAAGREFVTRRWDWCQVVSTSGEIIEEIGEQKKR